MQTSILSLQSLTVSKTLLNLSAAVFLSLFFISCQKGDAGPVGPAGAAGSTGAAGATGATGTANVIYSGWFTPSPYIKDTVFDVYGFSYTKTTADITQNILDSGTVLTFGKLDGYNTAIWPAAQVSQLPIVINYKFSTAGITYTDTWSALATLNSLKIQFVDDQNYYGSISTAHQFRYIIIPGGVKTTVTAVSPGVVTRNGNTFDAAQNANMQEVILHHNEMGYSEICHKLGIPE